MAPIQSTPIDLTRDTSTIQNTFVGNGSASNYISRLVTIIMWMFDKEEYHIYLDNDILWTMQTAHRSDNRGRSRKNLRTAIKKLLNNVTAEDPEKNQGSPINLDGDDQITWPIIHEYMGSLKKKATVDRNLAQKYKAGSRRNRGGGRNQQNNASSTAEDASPAGLTGSREDDMVEVLTSQSLSSYGAVRSALMYLYKRAGVVANEDLKAKMAQFIAGCKRRTIQTEKQELAQKISEGKEPMSVENQTSDTPLFTGIPPHVTLFPDIAELKREMQSLRKQFATDLNEIMDDRGVGNRSEFSTRRVLEALDIHTATLLNNREGRLQSGESETDKIPLRSNVIHDECDDCEESGEEEEGDSERIRSIKRQKRDAKTKLLIENRVQRAGLVNGRWTVLPQDFKFRKGMTAKHLIDSWFLEDQRKRIPPFLTLQPSNLTPSQQKVFKKMRAIM